ncbi:MAG: hypothetical protein VX976_01365 [Pseudomonadota bacterium]|nr:hypothetical protein [Pseudomonadota bacterium]
MVGSFVMIMIRNIEKLLLFLIISFLGSCESLKDFAGLSKPNLENDIIEQTPDLVLPPDFNKVARPGNSLKSSKRTNNFESQNIYQPPVQTVQPRVTNYIAPEIRVQSSPTPSDSLERFKENRRFTIGQWVYGQYVQGFKEGNLYYKPIYDKGYNFSRRYIPNQNVSSFLGVPTQIPENTNSFLNSENSAIQNLDNIPILD